MGDMGAGKKWRETRWMRASMQVQDGNGMGKLCSGGRSGRGRGDEAGELSLDVEEKVGFGIEDGREGCSRHFLVVKCEELRVEESAKAAQRVVDTHIVSKADRGVVPVVASRSFVVDYRREFVFKQVIQSVQSARPSHQYSSYLVTRMTHGTEGLSTVEEV
jgi:hypothetical protein